MSISEFTFGTTKGAAIVDDKTAIIASFCKMLFDFETVDATLIMNNLHNSLNKKPSYLMLDYVREDALL